MEDRWESAKAVCRKILDTSVNPRKAGKKTVFTEIKYYRKCSTAKKYKKDIQKKKYVINSYGIMNLSRYLDLDKKEPEKKKDKATWKKMWEVADNADNQKIEAVFMGWK